MAELRQLVINGPDPKVHKVIRWRCIDLQAEVARRFEVTVDEGTIGRWLGQLGLTRLQPRPYHPKKDLAAQEAFKKTSATARSKSCSAVPRTSVEVWFQDEARVGQKGSLSYVWSPIGSRPPIVRDNCHDTAYIFGAICPARGIGAAIITPGVSTECMNLHLAEISTQVAPAAIAALICDGAGWHQSGGESGARQHRAAAAAALCPGVEPDGERLGLPSGQQTVDPCLGQLRRHHPGLCRRLELVRR